LAFVEPRQTASQVSRSIHAKSIPRSTAEQFSGRVNQQHFDLLVVGFMGHTRLYEQIIGSTTERLVRLAPCTILVVK
jgi:nucleotide-binding universal stress UspA family protein